jgi:hypothetical protein
MTARFRNRCSEGQGGGATVPSQQHPAEYRKRISAQVLEIERIKQSNANLSRHVSQRQGSFIRSRSVGCSRPKR